MRIINKLTKEHLLKNKRRTFVTIVAIALTSTLLFSIGFGYSTFHKSEIYRLEHSNFDYDAVFIGLPFSKTKILDENKNVKKYEYSAKIYETDKIVYHTGYGDKQKDIYLEIYTLSDGYKGNLSYGRFPQNSDEIVVSSSQDLHLGESIEVNVTNFNNEKFRKKYTVVGIYNSDIIAGNPYHGSIGITRDSSAEAFEVNLNVYLKNKTHAYDKLFEVAKSLGLKETYEIGQGIAYEGMDANTSLLELYGNYRSSSKTAIIYVSLIILLAILSISCTIIIYNSFAISLSDRKRQIGILKSVGMTKSQVRKLIFKEALYLSVIAIPIGLIISYLFVSGIVHYINYLQANQRYFVTAIYPSYLLICLIFIILTITYSAFFPAMRASEITPIEAIRQNKDIKIKRGKIGLFSKLFGIHGFIASCNMKRNKSKYKTSVVGCVIVFILFMTVSTFINFMSKDLDINNYEQGSIIRLNTNFDEAEKVLTELKKTKNIKRSLMYEYKWASIDGNYTFTKEYKEIRNPDSKLKRIVLRLDDKNYEDIKKQHKIKNDNPIFINYAENIKNDKIEYIHVLDEKKSFKANFCEYESDNCSGSYTFNIINDVPDVLKNTYNSSSIIVNDKVFDSIPTNDKSDMIKIELFAKDYIKLGNDVKNILEKFNYMYEFDNYGIQITETLNDIKCYQIIIYALIILFGFISITSIINTISASMSLRKREFAILKSVGLEGRGFNKLFLLESLLLTIKTIIYGTLFSSIVIYIISDVFSLGIKKYDFSQMFPMKYYIFACLLVFILITVTIFSQMRRLKRDNIIETIRNENI